MGEYVGIWIDHEKAYLVSIKNHNEKIILIESNVKGHFRLSGGSRSATLYGPQDVASERKIEDRRKHHLNRYYRRIAGRLRDAESIVILGPGEAKIELERVINRSKDLSSRIVAIEPADKMTERQILAKVRAFFKP